MFKKPSNSLYRLWLFLILAATLIYIASFVTGLGIEIPITMAKSVCKVETGVIGIAESYILPLVPIVGAGITSAELTYLGICIGYPMTSVTTPVITVVKGILACMIALLFAVPTADSILFFAALMLYLTSKHGEDKMKSRELVKGIGSIYVQHVILVVIILLILTLLVYLTPGPT